MKYTLFLLSAALSFVSSPVTAQSLRSLLEHMVYNSLSSSFYFERFESFDASVDYNSLTLNGSTDLRFGAVTATLDSSLGGANTDINWLAYNYQSADRVRFSSVRLTAGYDVAPWLTPYIGYANYRYKYDLQFNGIDHASSYSSLDTIILGADVHIDKFAFAVEVENLVEDAWENPIYRLGFGYDLNETTAIYAAGTVLETDPIQFSDAQIGILRETDRYEAYAGFAYEHSYISSGFWVYETDDIIFGTGLTWRLDNNVRLIGSAHALIYSSGEIFPRDFDVALNLGVGYDLANNWTADLIAHDVLSDAPGIELAIKLEMGGKRVRLMDNIRRFQSKAGLQSF